MSIKKFLQLLLKFFVAPVLLLLVVCCISFLAYRAYLQDQTRERTRISSPHGIDSLETVNLGGVDQWILIRGQDASAPVLLFLHGGPGGGAIALARYYNAAIENHFVVVMWDQRGAGKSYSSTIPEDSMSVEQLISDTHDLVETLRTRFNAPKVYLVGHSWGSMLGALTVSRYPELFHAFVGVGQFVDDTETESISYQYVLAKAGETDNQEALRQLQAIGPPPYDDFSEMLQQRAWLEKLGGVFYSEVGNLWWMGATSPDISLLDGLRYKNGIAFSLRTMWDEVSRVNLFRQVPRIEVPVYFFLGRHDFNTPTEIAERYYQQLDAPQGKQLIWFENSAHMIPYEEPKRLADALVHRVLQETAVLRSSANPAKQ